MTEKEMRRPTAIVSFIPILFLIVLLTFVVKVFDTSALEGASQLALIVASSLCVAIGMIFYKVPWTSFESSIKENLANVSTALVMLLLIGAIGGTWMLSGVVPTMIYYGLQILNPKFFLLLCCIISSIVSVVTGSSWTTIATIGVALIGIGQGQGLPTSWVAGAVISGAYFGDKISPLSDTTVIASSSAGTPLFTHIKYMMITTIPSIVIAMLIFLIAGLSFSTNSEENISAFSQALTECFNINLGLLVIPLITLLMIMLKIPSLAVLFISALLAAIAIPIAQADVVSQIIDIKGDMTFVDCVKAVFVASYGNTSINTSNAMLNDLVATRGMAGMMNTIWLIITAMIFGGVMLGGGMLASITELIMRFVKKTLSLVASTVFTGIFCNVCISDQYLAIIMTTNIFKDYYEKNGYEARLLSRSAEDSATATSVLVPWNTCGMTQATVLNVATLSYLPYCFFNILSPIVSIIVAAFGYKIYRKNVK